MTRSSRHRSYKQSKHSSKDGKEHSESEKEDMKKMKDRNNGEGSVRVCRDSGSSDKRKQSKDPSVQDNGSTVEEHVALKRRKEKANDNWMGVGVDVDCGATAVIKEVKGEISRIDGDKSKPSADSKKIDGGKSKPSADLKRIDGEKSKPLTDSKSKNSRRHESDSEKKDASVGLLTEKDVCKSATSRVESKKKSEKDLGAKEVQQNENLKDKEGVVEREREREKKRKIIHDTKREKEPTVDIEASRKQEEEQQGNRGRVNTEYAIEDELRNPELERELERRMRKRGDGSTEKDKYYDAAKEREDGRLYSREERAKDGRYKDEKHKDGSSEDKHREDSYRASRHREDKCREDAERDGRRRDVKYREDGEKDHRHKDNKNNEYGEKDNRRKVDKYREDGEKDNRRKDDKYREDDGRDKRQRDDKYCEDYDRDKRQRDDKYREDGDRDFRSRDNKYREDGDRDNRHRGDRYDENGDRDYRHRGDKYHDHVGRDDRHRDDRYVEDGHMDSKIREEKNWEDVGRDSRNREGMQRDHEKDMRLRDVKYQDEQSRDRTSGKSDIKHLRDESNAAAELHRRKLHNHDASPIFDDRSSRYKDDKGMRRIGDKDDYGEIRSRSSTKQQNNDGEKKSFSSVRVDLVGDRGRSNSHNTALEVIVNHSRRRSSPSSSSHVGKDHYRLPKYEELKNRDYFHEEERIRHTVSSTKEYAGVAGVTEKVSLSRSIDKTLKKDDIHLIEFSGERHAKDDAHTPPLRLGNKSLLSTNTDRRQLNRHGVRRNLDIEDSGQRSDGSRDAKKADGDNKSVSSSFSRTSHFYSNPRSLLPPPPPFKMGPDSPLVLGSFEDRNRSKPNNRHRRIGDPTMGRAQGSPWRGVPNWASPVPNGFIPFQHGPPQVGFHPVMQQFPAPPMFGLRPPSMEMIQSVAPYHVPDGDRFSGHGRPHIWRNQMDEPIHGWDTSNAFFGDEYYIYGRSNWDNNSRTITGGQVWETSSGAMWKGYNNGASAPARGGYSARGQADEVWFGQAGLNAQNYENSFIAQVENNDVDQSNDAVEKNALETHEAIPKESLNLSSLSREEDTRLSHLYLSMLDVSQDLTEPEIYSQYTNLVGMDPSIVSEEDSRFLLVEKAIGTTTNLSNISSCASFFPTLNNSMLQKSMSLYKATREEDRALSGCKVPFSEVKYLMSSVALDEEGAEGAHSNDKPGDAVPECDQQEEVVVASALNKVKMEMSPEIIADKIDEPVLCDGQEKSEAAITVLEKVEVELDLVSEQQGTLDLITEEKSTTENGEKSVGHSLGKVEETNEASDFKGVCAVTHNVECGLSLFSDVSNEAVMTESVESESVNLSRIHLSPESTH